MAQILQEVYFGKEAIAPLQRQFSKIRAKFLNKPYNATMCSKNEPDIAIFNRMMEKTFGFKGFSFTISPDRSLNAYAISILLYQTREQQQRSLNALRANSNGFRFDTIGQIDGLFNLNSGLLNFEKVTDEEIMAIMLHELGHNYYEAVIGEKNCGFNLAIKLKEALINMNALISAKLKIRLVPDEQEIERELSGLALNDIVNAYNKARTKLHSILDSIAIKRIKKLVSIKREAVEDNFTYDMYSYTNEKFADTFATMYGYGMDLHSALFKMTDHIYKDYNQSRNPVIVAYTVFDLYLSDLLLYIFKMKDEHPDQLARPEVSIQYLKSEIAKESIDPKVKMDLINQVDQLQQLIDDYIEFPKDEDSYMIIRRYYSLLYKKFGGDRREQKADNDALFKLIDTRYKELKR